MFELGFDLGLEIKNKDWVNDQINKAGDYHSLIKRFLVLLNTVMF